MGWRRQTTAVLVAVLAGTVLTPGPSAAAAPPTVAPRASSGAAHGYRAVDLGTLGGESSYASAVSPRGLVVGRSQFTGGFDDYHGFLWRDGRMTDLGDFTPQDVNDRGQVVGRRDDIGQMAIWRDGVFTPLVGPSGAVDFARGIDQRGRVVGLVSSSEPGEQRVVLWSRGDVRRLPLGDVSGINRRGEVSGGRARDDGFYPAVWRRGRVTDLGAGTLGFGNSRGIDDRGRVLSWTFDAQQDERALLWRRGRPVDLGDLGGSQTVGIAVNGCGEVLVTSQTADGESRPALWRRGVLRDLTAVGLPADGVFMGLDDRGGVVGATRPADGVVRATVWRR